MNIEASRLDAVQNFFPLAPHIVAKSVDFGSNVLASSGLGDELDALVEAPAFTGRAMSVLYDLLAPGVVIVVAGVFNDETGVEASVVLLDVADIA